MRLLMNSIWINAPAKINLGLDVIRRREDGYHEVKMIMQSVRLFDRLTLTKSSAKEIKLETNLGFLPVDENNLVYKAAKLLLDEFEIPQGVHIKLDKRIPVAAGMAGGSTDGASCLLAMNRLFGLKLTQKQLCERALTLGADVPYCVMKGTALSEGIGEKLSRLAPAPDCHLLIAKPNIHVSTKFVYTNLKLDSLTLHPDIDATIEAINKGDIYELCDSLGNVLEDVTIPAHPEIAVIKDVMRKYGCIGTLMSGSGPTVFGIFDDKDKALLAKERCRSLPYHCFVFHTNFYR